VPRPTSVVTAEQLAEIPSDELRYELVEGHLHRMSPVGGIHGMLVLRLGSALAGWVQEHGLGVVMTEAGFVLARDPDTVRAPDLAFVRTDRIPAGGVPRGFWQGPPDLVVEILSPDDRPSDVHAKVQGYLQRDVRLVWILDPDARQVMVHRFAAAPATIAIDGTLDGEDVLPGFTYPLRRLLS
jgi:Uma2 family endonuclease